MTSIPRSQRDGDLARRSSPVSTVTMTRRAGRGAPRRSPRATGRGPPRAAIGTYGHHLDAQPAEGVDEDREAGQPVRVEVAEDDHPLAAGRGRGRSGRRKASASGSSAGSCSAVDPAGHERRERRGRPRRRGARGPSPRSPRPAARRPPELGVDGARSAETASGSGVRSRRQDARRDFTPAYLRTRRAARASGRHAAGAAAGCARSAWRALRRCPPTPARRRGAGAALKIDE